MLLSGGLDSTTVLAIARSEGYEINALSFSYGQRHSWELECARRITTASGVKAHRIAQIDLRVFGGSALTADISVPKGRSLDQMSENIPVTYVPARNTIFLSFAVAWAEDLGSSDIFIGVNALDYSGYPDCRPEFIEAFERLANQATKAGVEGHQRLTVYPSPNDSAVVEQHRLPLLASRMWPANWGGSAHRIYAWKSKYGGIDVSEAQEAKRLAHSDFSPTRLQNRGNDCLGLVVLVRQPHPGFFPEHMRPSSVSRIRSPCRRPWVGDFSTGTMGIPAPALTKIIVCR